MDFTFVFLYAVMELRAGLEIGWVDPESFAEMFLAEGLKQLFPLKIWHSESYGTTG